MAKQTELFENEGYIMGFSPRDKAIREARELEEAKKRASTYQNEPQTDRNARGGIVGQLQGNEQAARLYRLLSNGRKFGVIDIMEQMRIADPRAVVRTLRKMGVEVCGEWRKANGKRYKVYWIRR